MVANVQHGARTAEETVGISVFFDEGMEEGKIQAIGEQIRGWSEVREAKYIYGPHGGDHNGNHGIF